MGVLASLARRPRAGAPGSAGSPSPRRSASATALAVVSAAVTAVTAESTLTTAVAALPAGERSVAVSSYGLPTPQRSQLDALVTSRLPRLGSGPLRRQLVFREIGDTRGNAVVLGATDDLRERRPAGVRAAARLLHPRRAARSCSSCPTGSHRGRDAAPHLARPGPRRRRRRHRPAGRPAAALRHLHPRPGRRCCSATASGRSARSPRCSRSARTIGWVGPLDLARVKARRRRGLGRRGHGRSPTSSRAAHPTSSASPLPPTCCASSTSARSRAPSGSACSARRAPCCCSAPPSSAAPRCAATTRPSPAPCAAAAPRRDCSRGLLAGEVPAPPWPGWWPAASLGRGGGRRRGRARGGLPVLATAGAAVLAALPARRS